MSIPLLEAGRKLAATMGWMPRRPASVADDGAEIAALLEAVGARIARHRKERGLSQAQLAEHMGVSQNLVSAYELGKVRFGADTIVALAKVFRITTDELLGMKGNLDDVAIPSRRLLRRLARFDSLPKRRQSALLQTIDAVLQAAEA